MRKNELDKFNEHKHKDIDGCKDVTFRIEKLLTEQDFAVLCSQGDSIVYGSLVGFSIGDGLNHIIFATPNYTRKFKLLSESHKVSLLIDNRSDKQKRVSEIEAITAIGDAKQILKEDEIQNLKIKLVKKHPYLEELVKSESCGVFKVIIKKYLYVTHLQEVYEWTPT